MLFKALLDIQLLAKILQKNKNLMNMCGISTELMKCYATMKFWQLIWRLPIAFTTHHSQQQAASHQPQYYSIYNYLPG